MRAEGKVRIRYTEQAGFEACVLTVDARPTVPATANAVRVSTWDSIAWLQAQTRLPILLKGILHPAESRQAAELGLAGVLASNHGGRTLDTAPATVLLGRPYVYGLANAGAVGVVHVLRVLRGELESAMALCGRKTLDNASPTLLLRGKPTIVIANATDSYL